MKIRTRFAPSPTGMLHIGSLRTALYNYLFAKHQGGDFILRVEDTDRTREVPGALENIIDSLTAFGLRFDEGPGVGGPHEPYIQSKRLPGYQEAARELVAAGKAYYCFCTQEELDAMREAQMAAKRAPKYDKRCMKRSAADVAALLAANTPVVVRLNVEPGEELVFSDLVRGEVRFNSSDIDDQILLKSDGFPTYHLANVLDDHAMQITHVIRGEEWLPSTPKHLLLYRAFGWEPPVFAHIPLLLSTERKKMSKRDGDVAVSDFLAKGYLPEALLNFVVLLGWNPGEGSEREIFTLDELVHVFDMGHVHKAGAIFDLKKLDWINGLYIRTMSDAAIATQVRERMQARYPGMNDATLLKMVSVEKLRAHTLADFEPAAATYMELPAYDAGLLVWKKSTAEVARERLRDVREYIAQTDAKDFSSLDHIQKTLTEWISARGYANGDVLWPLRVALTGREQSPSPFEVAFVLGKEETLARIDGALQKLG